MGAARITIECRHTPIKMILETSESFDLFYDAFEIYDTSVGKRPIPRMRPKVSMEFEINEGTFIENPPVKPKRKPRKAKKKNG